MQKLYSPSWLLIHNLPTTFFLSYSQRHHQRAGGVRVPRAALLLADLDGDLRADERAALDGRRAR